MKIALIPIDNRPVCYTLPKEIANIDNDLELFMPERKLLGGLTSYANVDGILNWLDNLVKSEKIDAIIVSLDTIAYGGLISSRRCKSSLEKIKSRLDTFKDKLGENSNIKIYAFSSIMRISNNNVNEEEKEYWDKFGKKIFEYSYNFHKNGEETSDVPKEILSDYLATRQRNFEINKMYLDWFKNGVLDTLVFSKDDCAEFGLNVLEAEILQRKIRELGKGKNALVKTGADEIPLTLFARAVCDFNKKDKAPPKISPKFLAPENIYPHRNLISNYEDISIEKSVQAQIELAGGELSGGECTNEQDANIFLLVNNFEDRQGEIVMGVKTRPFSATLDLPQKPFMVADVRFANGADNKFVKKLFKKFEKEGLSSNFYGYSAWNTSANTLGSLICAGVVRYFSKDFNEEAFKKLQMTRFLDDWAYQANVRQILKETAKLKKGKQETVKGKRTEKRPDIRILKKLMLPYEKKLGKILNINTQIKYKFPWKRFFEVEVIIR